MFNYNEYIDALESAFPNVSDRLMTCIVKSNYLNYHYHAGDEKRFRIHLEQLNEPALVLGDIILDKFDEVTVKHANIDDYVKKADITDYIKRNHGELRCLHYSICLVSPKGSKIGVLAVTGEDSIDYIPNYALEFVRILRGNHIYIKQLDTIEKKVGNLFLPTYVEAEVLTTAFKTAQQATITALEQQPDQILARNREKAKRILNI